MLSIPKSAGLLEVYKIYMEGTKLMKQVIGFMRQSTSLDDMLKDHTSSNDLTALRSPANGEHA